MSMMRSNRPSRRKRLLVAASLVAVAGVGLLIFEIVRKVQEPQRVREELVLVEEVFGPIPDDATECILDLDIALDGSEGRLAIRRSDGWEHCSVSWPRRRPPEALCEMHSMKGRSEFLGEFGTARWVERQLRYRQAQ
jgi:hypothetical protein